MSIDLNTYKTAAAQKSVRSKPDQKAQLSLSKGFSDKKKEVFYRELGILLRSGVDFKKALEIVSQQFDKKGEQELILGIKSQIVRGKRIYESMRETGQFSPYEFYSVQIGEETRKLEEVLTELQKYFGRKIAMRRQIVSVLTYPCIVMLVTLLVLWFMLSKVVPMFSSVFRQFGGELPASTKFILMLSRHSGAMFLGVLLLAAGFVTLHYLYGKTDTYRRVTSGIAIRIPYFGQLIRKIYIARFCQSMSLLLSSRTTLITSLSLTSKMIRFYPIEAAMPKIRETITKGSSFSDSLRDHKIFDGKLVSMVEVAEHVNQLDTMFARLTEQYNEDIGYQSKMIGVVLEPMIIIIIGIIVGVIMVSMYAPMFELSKIIHT
ncbi:type II secretion system F family protein [Flavobacterium sp. MAH-1]|uniref:General secretion pathway protein F n=1 Tax=Flavobacterium agri TaxID=2743471 RepID=A0A7Y9C3N5_9FLAO|nr:type II secretion system F family protein [Flavobacterium agri]NUY79262.1 type II secretion system F family protein [Flavobacterium agri]NYA69286.1 type II secretion system F family protein [Flavobacterium agri]